MLPKHVRYQTALHPGASFPRLFPQATLIIYTIFQGLSITFFRFRKKKSQCGIRLYFPRIHPPESPPKPLCTARFYASFSGSCFLSSVDINQAIANPITRHAMLAIQLPVFAS